MSASNPMCGATPFRAGFGPGIEGWQTDQFADLSITARSRGTATALVSANTANGTPVQLWTCTGQPNQRWTSGSLRLQGSVSAGLSVAPVTNAYAHAEV